MANVLTSPTPTRRSGPVRCEGLVRIFKTAEIEVYPDTPHGFYADYRPSYRKEQADDAWKKLLEWFKKNGVA